jgi:hypothetical protein
MRSELDPDSPACPHCDSACAPERIGVESHVCDASLAPELTGTMHGYDALRQVSYVVESWLCPVCSRTFRVRR